MKAIASGDLVKAKEAEKLYPPKIEARGGWGTEYDYNEPLRQAYLSACEVRGKEIERLREALLEIDQCYGDHDAVRQIISKALSSLPETNGLFT